MQGLLLPHRPGGHAARADQCPRAGDLAGQLHDLDTPVVAAGERTRLLTGEGGNKRKVLESDWAANVQRHGSFMNFIYRSFAVHMLVETSKIRTSRE